MGRKPKQTNLYVSLSFSAPAELEEPMNQAAAARGMNRSQYISWLVQQDIYLQRGQKFPHAGPPDVPRIRKIPPRIRRKPQSS